MSSKTKALFLDRDGVINEDHGYVHSIDNFNFMEGIFTLCRRAIEQGYLLIVITNQSGIGRGYYTNEDFHTLMKWVKSRFNEEGVALTHVYHCPYHVQGIGRYKRDSEDRKPKPGMIVKAQKKYNIDLSQSILIGDKETDIEAGNNAGVGLNILLTTDAFAMTKADKRIASLQEALALFF